MKTNGIILYVGGFELPDKNAAAQRVLANGKVLKALGHTVLFLGIDMNRSFGSGIQRQDTYEGFQCFSVGYPKNVWEWLGYLSSIKYLSEFKNFDFTHIIAYNYPSLALARLMRYCRKKNIHLLGDCTEWYEVKGISPFRLIKSLDVILRMKHLHPKLDGLIVISDFLMDYYGDRNVRLVNIPPLVDTSMDKWHYNDSAIENTKLKLVYAGSPGKGGKDRLDKVISALSDIKLRTSLDFELRVIGIDSTEYVKSFNSVIPENLNKNLLFLGRVPHLNAIDIIKNSHFQVFIRDKNIATMAGFPTKFVEAITCGTPVLSNGSSNISRYIVPYKTGFLLDTTSHNSLVTTLQKSMTVGITRIIEMKQHCRNSGLFNYTNFIENFGTFLTEVQGKHHSIAPEESNRE